MERLKAILADKILDVSSSHGEDVRVKIDRMQRFRDFANACQTLMVKYPQIEDELIKMINDGDFDTKVASSRVDSVIRLTDSYSEVAKGINTEALIGENTEISPIEEIIEETEERPEDIDYEEVAPSPEDDYAPFEDLNITGADNPSIDEQEAEAHRRKQKEIILRIVQVAGIILAVIVLIIIIKFVINNWVVILSIIGGLAILTIGIWFLTKKKN